MFSTDPCTERGVSFKLKIDWRPSSRCAADLTEGRSQDPQNLDISDKMVTTTSFHLEHWKFDRGGIRRISQVLRKKHVEMLERGYGHVVTRWACDFAARTFFFQHHTIYHSYDPSTKILFLDVERNSLTWNTNYLHLKVLTYQKPIFPLEHACNQQTIEPMICFHDLC